MFNYLINVKKNLIFQALPRATQNSAELHRSRVWIFRWSRRVEGIRKPPWHLSCRASWRRNIFRFNPGVCATLGTGGSIWENTTKGNPSGTNVSWERWNMLLGNLANAKTKTHNHKRSFTLNGAATGASMRRC